MKEGIIKDIYEVVIREIQLVLSLFYLLIVAVGMVFNYFKYNKFGINIFQYADVFDFLIAPFEDFRIIGFTLLSVFLTSVFLLLDVFWKNKFPESYSRFNFGWDKKKWFNLWFRFPAFLLLMIFYFNITADIYGESTSDRIKGSEDIELIFMDKSVKKGKAIGKTREVFFLLDGKDVLAVPLSSNVKFIKTNP